LPQFSFHLKFNSLLGPSNPYSSREISPTSFKKRLPSVPALSL